MLETSTGGGGAVKPIFTEVLFCQDDVVVWEEEVVVDRKGFHRSK